MTETNMVAAVARDLGVIASLAADLPEQAEHQANSRVMTGGAAMGEMGHVANLEAWQHRQDAAEQQYLDGKRAAFPETVHEDDGDEPVLQALLFWSENLRTDWDVQLDVAPTIASEAGFLRFHVEHLWATEPRFEDLAADVSRAKRKLENVLKAGERSEVGVPCLYSECGGKRIIRKMEPGRDSEGHKVWRQSDWFCPSCHRKWGEDQYARMVVAAAESQRYVIINGETWCSVEHAAKDTGIPSGTIRSWVSRKRVGVACVISGRRRGFVSLMEVQERRAQEKSSAA